MKHILVLCVTLKYIYYLEVAPRLAFFSAPLSGVEKNVVVVQSVVPLFRSKLFDEYAECSFRVSLPSLPYLPIGRRSKTYATSKYDAFWLKLCFLHTLQTPAFDVTKLKASECSLQERYDLCRSVADECIQVKTMELDLGP